MKTNSTIRQQYTSRETTPRQRRLQAERRALIAQYHQTISAVGGILLLAVIIICLLFLA